MKATAVLSALALLGGCGPGAATSSPPSASSSVTTRAAAPVPVTPSTRSTDEAHRAIAATLVAARGQALATRDKRSWLDTVADLTSPFATAQAQVFDRMLQLPVTSYQAQDVEVGAPLDAGQRQQYGDQAWVASIDLAYRFAGFDTGVRTFHADYVVAPRGSGWGFAEAIQATTEAQPWDLTPLVVLRSPTTLAIGNVPVATLRSYLSLGDSAHQVISGVWGSAQPSVIVAPATLAQLGSQLRSSSSAGFSQVAAVTDGPLSAGGPATSDRVYVNPDAFARLTAAGRREVVTHELTHVTVRGSTTRPVPTWLSEGFADYVGYTTVDLPPSSIAADLLTRVRAGTGPTSLPADADFDPANGTIAPVYNAAWLAVTRMVQRYGVARTVDFYRQVAGRLRVVDPAATPAVVARQAFPAVLGESEDAFVADWLGYLRRLAQ